MAKDDPHMPDLIARRDSKTAVRLWRQYFALDSQGRPSFSGSQFERFRGGGDKATRDVFTSDDLVAVSLLSVNVPAQSALRILGPDADRCSALLGAIPTGLTLADSPESTIGSGSSAAQLWRLLRQSSTPKRGAHDGIGKTTTSKLIARKRPDLIPVWDSVVTGLTGQDSKGSWVWLRSELRGSDSSLDRWIRSTAPDELMDISTIRLLDVLLWMVGSGRHRG